MSELGVHGATVGVVTLLSIGAIGLLLFQPGLRAVLRRRWQRVVGDASDEIEIGKDGASADAVGAVADGDPQQLDHFEAKMSRLSLAVRHTFVFVATML